MSPCHLFSSQCLCTSLSGLRYPAHRALTRQTQTSHWLHRCPCRSRGPTLELLPARPVSRPTHAGCNSMQPYFEYIQTPFGHFYTGFCRRLCSRNVHLVAIGADSEYFLPSTANSCLRCPLSDHCAAPSIHSRKATSAPIPAVPQSPMTSRDLSRRR